MSSGLSVRPICSLASKAILSSLCRDFITCFGNDGRVLADAGLVAEAADVFAEHSEGILVPHDQVRHSAAGPAVVLIDREPLLMPRETEKEGG